MGTGTRLVNTEGRSPPGVFRARRRTGSSALSRLRISPNHHPSGSRYVQNESGVVAGDAVGPERPGRSDEPVLVFRDSESAESANDRQRWNPIFAYLSQVTGYRFQLRMGPNVQATNAMMARGEFDLAFTNHTSPRIRRNLQNHRNLGTGPIFGVVAVTAASPIKQLQGSAGMRIAYPSQNAFVAYAVPGCPEKRRAWSKKKCWPAIRREVRWPNSRPVRWRRRQSIPAFSPSMPRAPACAIAKSTRRSPIPISRSWPIPLARRAGGGVPPGPGRHGQGP